MSSTAPSGAVLDLRVSASPLAQMGPLDVHALYKLRVDVFVAEQDCPYAEIDEIDADPGTTHLLARAPWQGPAELAATLRIYSGDGVMHLGRVCTAAPWRGQGLAARLVRAGLEMCGDQPVEIGAQAHLQRGTTVRLRRSGPSTDGRTPRSDGTQSALTRPGVSQPGVTRLLR